MRTLPELAAAYHADQQRMLRARWEVKQPMPLLPFKHPRNDASQAVKPGSRLRTVTTAIIAALLAIASLSGCGEAKSQTFNDWLAVHCKTCQQCDESMNRNPDVSLCEVAFKRMQDGLKAKSPLCSCTDCTCEPCICGTNPEIEPMAGILDGSLIERFERRADRIEARAEQISSGIREHGRAIERVANLFRGIYWLAIAALGSITVACIAFGIDKAAVALKQLASVFQAMGTAIQAWRGK